MKLLKRLHCLFLTANQTREPHQKRCGWSELPHVAQLGHREPFPWVWLWKTTSSEVTCGITRAVLWRPGVRKGWDEANQSLLIWSVNDDGKIPAWHIRPGWGSLRPPRLGAQLPKRWHKWAVKNPSRHHLEAAFLLFSLSLPLVCFHPPHRAVLISPRRTPVVSRRQFIRHPAS